MKLIIDIPDNDYRHIKEYYEKNDIVEATYSYIYHGIPLDEQEPKTRQFAEWVATEIFDEMWEYNYDGFAELACRKLAKLGIVRAKGDEWELVEQEEERDKE